MQQKLLNHLLASQLLPQNSTFIVAVSGGIDSVVLLDLLARLAESYNWQMAVAHLNHNIRPDAMFDAHLVSQLAERYGLRFFFHQLTDPSPSEGDLRRARYQFLESVRDGAKAHYVVTAHHGDDRIETSVINTIRGADRYGLTALRARQGTIIRPLLPFSKGEIIMYAKTNQLPYREDSTNKDPAYRRNFIRHHLLPQASAIDPDFRLKHTDLLDHLHQLTDKIDWQLNQLLEKISVEITDTQIVLKRANFLKLSEQIQLNLLAYIVRQLSGGLALTSTNLARGLRFTQTAKTGAQSNALPHLLIERVYDTLIVALADSFNQTHVPTLPLRPNREVDVAGFRINIRTLPEPCSTKNYLIKPSNLFVRGWQAGDRISPVGMTGRRKVSDIFTDKKIPRRNRLSWPMIVDANNTVVCVAGLAINRESLAKATDPHYQLIVEEYA